jgi:early secretory antigenic target protein ESAT-6
MSEQVWNFAGIEAGVSDLQGSAATTAGLLDEGKGSLAALSAAWGGSGSEAYQSVQMRWDEASLELNNALQNLASTCAEAGSSMQTTEHHAEGLFTG